MDSEDDALKKCKRYMEESCKNILEVQPMPDNLFADVYAANKNVPKLEFPPVDTVWRHKNGNKYVVIMHSNVECTRPDYPPTVIYKNKQTGVVYNKPLSEWYRSRVLMTKDWTEDYDQENGNYMNTCKVCLDTFKGNKHRRICRICVD